MQWVRVYHHKITNPYIPVVYLDKKWFYTTNRRRKIKILPRGPLEELEVDVVIQPKIRSRRYPVKFVFLGVVACICSHRKFDGKILLEGVSEQIVVATLSLHTHFSNDIHTC